jgi:hypothetical protein
MHHKCLVIIALVVSAIVVRSTDAEAAVRRYAFVVAHGGGGGELAPLEYADDDGARYYELFSQLADDVRLYTVLDPASQQIHPAVAAIARMPRRADVLRGLTDVFARVRRDVDAGHEVVFYFVLVGHGTIGDGGEGSVALLDGAFSRSDMFQEVLAKSPATTNHVIVDACNAFYLVHRRGADDAVPARKDPVQAFVAREDLARYPNTGVLLSTSSEKATHEWSVYRAGVFSHELRSAMAGGADVNGDGQIVYSEVAAFLAAANQHVTEQARVDVFSRSPAADVRRPLVDLSAARFAHWLRVPAGAPARIYLEDQRGVRYLDAYVGENQEAVFGLVPSSLYYLRTADGTREATLELGLRARIDLDRRAMKPPAIASRGAVEQSFRLDLYSEPFDANYYRGFAAAAGAPGIALDGARWLPGPADAAFVDSELRRLNRAARGDAALRLRLATNRADILRAIETSDHARAATLLRRAQMGR